MGKIIPGVEATKILVKLLVLLSSRQCTPILVLMSDLNDLQKQIVGYRDERDWKQFHNPKDLAISLSLEAAEVLEHFQWKSPEEMTAYVKSHKDQISDELADVLYWVLLMANDLDIDIIKASHAKLQKNRIKYPVEKSKGNHKKYTELD